MNSHIIRWSFLGIAGLTAIGALSTAPESASAASAPEHPDFLWSPLRVVMSNRLFVGGLHVHSSD